MSGHLPSPGRGDGARPKAGLARQEAVIQSLEAKVQDLEDELSTAQLSMAHRETLHSREVARLQERLAIYEPEGRPTDTALPDTILSLRRDLQEKIEGIEQMAAARVKAAVIESRLHAKPAYKSMGDRKDEAARRTRDEFRGDFVRKLTEEKTALATALEDEAARNVALNKEVAELQEVISTLKQDLKKAVQEQIIAERARSLEYLSGRRSSSPQPPPQGSRRPSAGCNYDLEEDVTRPLSQRGSIAKSTGTLPSLNSSFKAKPPPSHHGATMVKPVTGPPTGFGALSSPSPSRRPGGGVGGEKVMKQRIGAIMKAIDSLRDELNCLVSATLVTLREAGLYHLALDPASHPTDEERLRLCSYLANNTTALQALLRLAQAAALPARSQRDPFADTALTRRLPLLSTELDTRRICGLVTGHRELEPLPD